MLFIESLADVKYIYRPLQYLCYRVYTVFDIFKNPILERRSTASAGEWGSKSTYHSTWLPVPI